MQVPAYVSLRVVVGCYLQPAFPGARPLIRRSRFPAVHLTSPPRRGLEGQVTSPLLARATTRPVLTYLPKTAKPTTGPRVLVHLPALGPPGSVADTWSSHRAGRPGGCRTAPPACNRDS